MLRLLASGRAAARQGALAPVQGGGGLLRCVLCVCVCRCVYVRLRTHLGKGDDERSDSIHSTPTTPTNPTYPGARASSRSRRGCWGP